MLAANCSIFGCTKSRTTKGAAIFGIPKKMMNGIEIGEKSWYVYGDVTNS